MVKPATIFFHLAWSLTSAAETGQVGTGYGIGSSGASAGIRVLFAGIILIVFIPLFYFVVRKTLNYLRARREKTFIEELTIEARRREKDGEFVSAALAYEKLKNLERAAELYEKGRDFMKAADLYESLGLMDKVSEMYETGGDLKKAAEVRMFSGDFAGAAGIYNRLGDKHGAAEALERSGNRLAAARAYREAKDYIRASALLKDAGMYKEAAEMYAISLAGTEVNQESLDRFYTHASLLETAGESEKAAKVFRTVFEVDPDYRDVRQRIDSPGDREDPGLPRTAADEGDEAARETPTRGTNGGSTTLLSMIRAGRMEPSHCFRLWVQVLKALDQRQRDGALPDILTPEGIVIDSGNNVTFSENVPKDFAYIAPEVVTGSSPDSVSLIYSMGVILYEMLTGSLDAFGLKRPGEVEGNVPAWLEELTLKCCERRREDRYQGLDEIFAVLLDLKKKRQG